MARIIVDEVHCKGCGLCVTEPDGCIGCSSCFLTCPDVAITVVK